MLQTFALMKHSDEVLARFSDLKVGTRELSFPDQGYLRIHGEVGKLPYSKNAGTVL